MTAPRRGRQSLADQKRAYQAQLDGLALLTGRPRLVLGAGSQKPEAKPRAAPVPSGYRRELGPGGTAEEVGEAIKAHPRVVWFARYNSGTQVDEGPAGKRMTWFYRLFLRDRKMRTRGHADYGGMLDDGRFFAIEAKSEDPNAKPTREQSEFLAVVAAGGGVAGVARCAADVAAILGPP